MDTDDIVKNEIWTDLSRDERAEKIEHQLENTDREITQVETLIQTIQKLPVIPNSVAQEKVISFIRELEKEKEYLEDIQNEERSSIQFIQNY